MHTGIMEKTLRVGYTQGDVHGRMKLSEVLRAAQQLAQEHCDHLGFTEAEMRRRGRAFVLAKLQIDVQRLPMQGETLRIVTHAYAPKRLVYQRTTALETPEGTSLVTVDARWTLIDTNTWRITRSGMEDFVAMALPMEDFDDIRMSQVEFTDERSAVQVRYTMLDINGHVNNAVYADWAQDALGAELLDGAEIRKLTLLYHREARHGMQVQIHHAQAENIHFLRGEHENGHCFDAVAEMA